MSTRQSDQNPGLTLSLMKAATSTTREYATYLCTQALVHSIGFQKTSAPDKLLVSTSRIGFKIIYKIYPTTTSHTSIASQQIRVPRCSKHGRFSMVSLI